VASTGTFYSAHVEVLVTDRNLEKAHDHLTCQSIACFKLPSFPACVSNEVLHSSARSPLIVYIVRLLF
jgi:hypothetical protein